MCKIAVLFDDPTSPGIIRIALKGHDAKFFQTDAKGVAEKISSMNPLPIVALDATDPKKSQRVLNRLPPGIKTMYVGGKTRQQEQMENIPWKAGWKEVANQL